MAKQKTEVICLTSLGWFNRKKSLLEKKRRKLLSQDGFSMILWKDMAAGEALFTLDMFFIALNSQNLLSQHVTRELAEVIGKNTRLQQAILAALGGTTDLTKAYRTKIKSVIDPNRMSAEGIITLGWQRLFKKLEEDPEFAQQIVHCKEIAKRLRAIDPTKLGTTCSLAIVRDPKLWAQIFPPKKWYETKKRFLARKERLAQNSVFAQRLLNIPEALQAQADSLMAPSSFASITGAVGSSDDVLRPLNLGGSVPKPKEPKEKVSDPVTEGSENSAAIISGVLIRIEIDLESFRAAEISSDENDLLLYEMVQGIDAVQTSLSQDKLRALGSTTDLGELSRGGTYYQISEDLLNKTEVTLDELRETLRTGNLTGNEIERVLHLILQTSKGLPDRLAAALTAFGISFVDLDCFESPKSGAKIQRIWKQDGVVNIYLESIMQQKMTPLFGYNLHLAYDTSIGHIGVKKAQISILDEKVAQEVERILTTKNLSCDMKLGVKCFTLGYHGLKNTPVVAASNQSFPAATISPITVR